MVLIIHSTVTSRKYKSLISNGISVRVAAESIDTRKYLATKMSQDPELPIKKSD
jgi:hypothetical protein